jgi:RNA polymerase-interacting CarD/CdnL/TRCF family regulator
MPLLFQMKKKVYQIINNKLKSSQTYDIAQNTKILHRAAQHLSQHNL